MSYRILIVTDHALDAVTLRDVLGDARDGPYVIEWLRRLSTALARLENGGVDAILVDLSLPDSAGVATFDRLFAAAPHLPIMLLSAREEEDLARLAIQRGAQGYLSKGHFIDSLVPQALRSMIERKAVDEALYTERTRAHTVLSSIGDAVLYTDTAGNVEYLNRAAEELTGWPLEDARGRSINEVFRLVSGKTREPERHTVELVLQKDQPMGLAPNTLLIRRDGSETMIEDSAAPIHDRNGRLTGAVVVFHDVSASQAMTRKMAHLAQHDFLTDLPNRVLFNQHIEEAIAWANRHDSSVALLYLDLDNFKVINDSLGHAVGDRILLSVTQRLKSCVRASDTVSRQGGDEFVILITGVADERAVAATAEKILAVLACCHAIGGRELYVTSSIGISTYPADGADAASLIQSADTAMYHAKDEGRNNYQFFSSDMNARAMERQFIETGLRGALKNGDFVLHYQPVVDLHSGMVTGAEALLRWNRADGLIAPAKFVPIAEVCGLIVPIGRWVLHEACRQAQQWVDEGMRPMSIAVNISAVEFRQAGFVAEVRAALASTGFDPRMLQLEITESVLMSDADSSIEILHELKNAGVRLALDDFGTGYSSLSYLRQFPIDILKIDQSFVRDIGAAADSSAIVSAVIGMGNVLDKRVVAEGVETREQLAFLRQSDCREGQGFLFAEPLGADQFRNLAQASATPGTGATRAAA